MFKIKNNICAGCGACLSVCPANALSIKDGKAKIDQNNCTKCGQCVGICPFQAVIKAEK